MRCSVCAEHVLTFCQDRLSIFLMLTAMSCIVLSLVVATGNVKDMHPGLCIHHAQTHVQSLTLKTDDISGYLFWLLLTCDCNAFRGEMQRYRANSAYLFSGVTACSRREHPCSRSSSPTRADATRSAWGHSLSTFWCIGVMGRHDFPL